MNSTIHFSLAALLALPAIGCAQEGHAPNKKQAETRRAAQEDQPSRPEPKRRLESVTWNSVTHELTWLITTGQRSDQANYEINLDDATMSFGGDKRRFSQEEASNVFVLMDLIAKYAVDSTVWWEDGQGEPVNPNQPKNQPKQEHAPAIPAPNDDDSVAVLKVGTQPTAAIDPQALRLEIQRLQKKLAELQRLERAMTAAQLARN